MVIRIALGRIVATPGALAFAEAHKVDVHELLERHRSGDWGQLGEEDWQANEDAVEVGERVMSSFLFDDKGKLWIITERDRSVTTILLPEEY